MKIADLRNWLAVGGITIVVIAGGVSSLAELTNLANADSRLEKRVGLHIKDAKILEKEHLKSHAKHQENFDLLEKSLQRDRVQAARMEERQKSLQKTLESQGKTTDLILQQLRSLRFRSDSDGTR